MAGRYRNLHLDNSSDRPAGNEFTETIQRAYRCERIKCMAQMLDLQRL